MAIFIPGSRCVICRQAVAAGEQMLFPPFTGNLSDPIYDFSDAVAHQKCFSEAPERQQVEAVLERIGGMGRNRVCLVCGLPIRDPDEYFPLTHLTEDPANPLWCWNFTQFHRSCLPKWDHLQSAIKQMRVELSVGRWRGPAMERIVQQLERAANQTIVSP
jgi:predicted nucleic acid-binding Zn ribbon protein